MILLFSWMVEFFSKPFSSFEFLNDEPTYMDEVCADLNFAGNDGLCAQWFFEATDHCFKKLFKLGNQTNLWNLLQDILFETASKALLDPNHMNMYPSHLTAFQCEKLLRDIKNDYLLNARPRQILLIRQTKQLVAIFSLILSSAFLLVTTHQVLKLLVNVYQFLKLKLFVLEKHSPFGDNFSMRKKLEPILNARSLDAMKYETEYLRLKYEVQSHHFFLGYGMPTLILKTKSKINFLKSIVYGQPESIGRFNHLQESCKEPTMKCTFTPKTTVNKVLTYVNQFNTGPLHILLMFDDEPEIIESDKVQNGKIPYSLKSERSTPKAASTSKSKLNNPLPQRSISLKPIISHQLPMKITRNKSSLQNYCKTKDVQSVSQVQSVEQHKSVNPTASSTSIRKIRIAGSVFEKKALSRPDLTGCHTAPTRNSNVMPISKIRFYNGQRTPRSSYSLLSVPKVNPQCKIGNSAKNFASANKIIVNPANPANLKNKSL